MNFRKSTLIKHKWDLALCAFLATCTVAVILVLGSDNADDVNANPLQGVEDCVTQFHAMTPGERRCDEALARRGNVVAQARLGELYADGQGGAQDYEQAAYWWRKAADQGDEGAQDELGSLYEQGQGVSQSYPQAANWYRKAAKQGSDMAQYHLAVLYADGKGVWKDTEEATEWAKKACDQDYRQACKLYNDLTESNQ